MRTLLTMAVVTVVFAGIGLNFVRDPFAADREQLRQRFEENPPEPEAGGADFKADYAKWRKDIEARTNLWDALVPPPEKHVAAFDPAREMDGIVLLPGSSGSGANARVRLATPGAPRGRMYKAGDSVKPTVTIVEIAPDRIVFDITQGGQNGQVAIPRR